MTSAESPKPEDIKLFWEARAENYKGSPKEGLSNLETDAFLHELKVTAERLKVSDYLKPSPRLRLLDLGAGHLEWATFFSNDFEKIDAVEYSGGMVEIAEARLTEQKIKNVSVHHCAAQDFSSKNRYERVLISGLGIYLLDDEFEKLLRVVEKHTESGAKVIYRDGVAKHQEFKLTNHFSQELNAEYSAIYRTAEVLSAAFDDIGFELIRYETMFPSDSPLNKREETILMIFEFEKRE